MKEGELKHGDFKAQIKTFDDNGDVANKTPIVDIPIYYYLGTGSNLGKSILDIETRTCEPIIFIPDYYREEVGPIIHNMKLGIEIPDFSSITGIVTIKRIRTRKKVKGIKVYTTKL